MPEQDLKPCAACGSGYVEITGNPFISGRKWIACGNCGHTGPACETDWEAIELWNRRKPD